MRHSILTCRNHPDLRWSCKCTAVGSETPGEPARYNGSRHIIFKGRTTGVMFDDLSGLRCDFDADECDCPSSDLIIAPEDLKVKR